MCLFISCAGTVAFVEASGLVVETSLFLSLFLGVLEAGFVVDAVMLFVRYELDIFIRLVNVLRRRFREDNTVGSYLYISHGCESEIQLEWISAKMKI